MSKTKEYRATVCFTGYLYLYVEADNEEDARGKAKDHNWQDTELHISSSSVNVIEDLEECHDQT